MRAAWAVVLGACSLAMVARPDAQLLRRSQPPLRSGTATLTGTVLTDAGLPVSGAHVTLTAPAFQAKETDTDAQGRFTFTNVPEDSIELHASAAAFLEAVYGEKRPGSLGTSIRLRAGQRLDVIIHMFRGSVIAGSVVNDDGQPVAAIKVWASRLGRAAMEKCSSSRRSPRRQMSAGIIGSPVSHRAVTSSSDIAVRASEKCIARARRGKTKS